MYALITIYSDSSRGLDWRGFSPTGRQSSHHTWQGPLDLLEPQKRWFLRTNRHYQTRMSYYLSKKNYYYFLVPQQRFRTQPSRTHVTSIQFEQDGDVVTADSDGFITVYSVDADGAYFIRMEFEAHNKGISSLVMLSEGTLLSGGEKDRKIAAWDSLQNYKRITDTKVLYKREKKHRIKIYQKK